MTRASDIHHDACVHLRAMTHREARYRMQTSPGVSSDTKNGSVVSIAAQSERSVVAKFEHSERERVALCRWASEVAAFYQLDKKIVACAVNYFDRFLAGAPETHDERRKKRLLIAVCLSTSEKVHGCQRDLALGFPQLITMCRGNTSIEELIDLENELFFKLDWLLHPPTSVEYVWPICILLKDCVPGHIVDNIGVNAMQIMESVSQSAALELRDSSPSSLAVAVLAYCLRGSPFEFWSELYRNGICVNWADSARCFYELDEFLKAPEFPDVRGEEKDSTRDNRMGSPVGVAPPPFRGRVSV